MKTATFTFSNLIDDLKSKYVPQVEQEEWLTPRQLSKELQVAQSSVYRWIRSGELRAYDLSSGIMGKTYYRIKRSDIDNWLEERVSRSLPVGDY